MIYYIGDTHFGHANVIKHDSRPYDNADEMDRCLIDNWNHRVTNNDHVYVVGDFAFRNKNDFTWYLNQLKGHKHLLVGNHDKKLLKNVKAVSMFESVDYITEIKDGDHRIVLCHYPMASWDRAAWGTLHVYAHIHNNIYNVTKFMCAFENAYNAGCMINGYQPVTIEELMANNAVYREQVLAGEGDGENAGQEIEEK